MLTFNLKKEWYEKIRSGEKRIEYREVKDYWKTRLTKGLTKNVIIEENPNPDNGFNFVASYPCILRLGYTKRYMTAKITKIEVADGKDTDLHIDKPVYAIYLTNVKEAVE